MKDSNAAPPSRRSLLKTTVADKQVGKDPRNVALIGQLFIGMHFIAAARFHWQRDYKSLLQFRTSYARNKSAWCEGYSKSPFKVKNGYVDLPTAPGLGIELDEELMKKNDMYGHDWQNQETYDPDDGSVVDW